GGRSFFVRAHGLARRRAHPGYPNSCTAAALRAEPISRAAGRRRIRARRLRGRVPWGGRGLPACRQHRAAGRPADRGHAKTARQGGRGRHRPVAVRRRRVRFLHQQGDDPLGQPPAVRAVAKTRRRARALRPVDLPAVRIVAMGRPSREAGLLDTELDALPPELRWREWMTRVEAVIFAAPEPVTREMLSRIVGRDCSIDLLIQDIANELAARPYEIVAIAGGWQFRTRPRQAE